MNLSVGSITSTTIASNAITSAPISSSSISSVDLSGISTHPWNKRYNVYETINGYDVEIPLPGLSADEVGVFYEGCELRVVASPNKNPVDRSRKIVTVGFFKESAEYKINIPGCESVDAEMKNGILYVNAIKKHKGVEVAIKTA